MLLEINGEITPKRMKRQTKAKTTPSCGWVLVASVRHSTHGKGHEEGGSTYAKVGLSLRSPPLKSSSIYPHNQSLPTLLLCAHLHL